MQEITRVSGLQHRNDQMLQDREMASHEIQEDDMRQKLICLLKVYEQTMWMQHSGQMMKEAGEMR